MAKLISKTYGDALFELAVEKHCEDSMLAETETVLNALADNPDFSRLMNHPKILKEEKLKILEEVFKGRVSDELTGFMSIIVKKDRFNEMEEIFRYFISRVKEYKGIGVAFVTTPLSLNEIQKATVKERLLETTSYKEVEIHYQVDEGLIGGMVIRIGDRVVDSSVRTKLEELKRQLLKVRLDCADR
ncbi:MAG: ATP synthase F1 subunit delta [Lachnospiraceae bacterium]